MRVGPTRSYVLVLNEMVLVRVLARRNRFGQRLVAASGLDLGCRKMGVEKQGPEPWF